MVSREIPSKVEYDLVVIGSGPGGQRAAVQAAKLGKSVLVIEKEKIGGACLHTGTIPSKALREAALQSKKSPDQLREVMTRTLQVMRSEVALIEEHFEKNRIEYVRGAGFFESPNDVAIAGAKQGDRLACVQAQYVVIATGTRPRHPENVIFDSEYIYDSDTILRMKRLPKTLGVIGAGVIGCEYASIFAKLGVQVSLIDKKENLLPSIDPEVVEALKKEFQSKGIELILGCDFEGTRKIKVPSGQTEVRIELTNCNPCPALSFEAVLYCMGRTGNIEGLNLKAAGLCANERGLLSVNGSYQTKQSHIYAVGDIIGAPALAASSAEQGRLAIRHAFLHEEYEFPKTFPYGIYTIPEISSVGVQASDLEKAGIPFVSGRAAYNELARGKIMRENHGFLKLLVHAETKKILGVHVIGAQATELVHIGQVAMAFGADIYFFLENVFNYPTLAEAYKVAAYNAVNKLR